ncbi:hypothetical protein HDU67_004870, partial [Dinochytrium kinnereticum]
FTGLSVKVNDGGSSSFLPLLAAGAQPPADYYGQGVDSFRTKVQTALKQLQANVSLSDNHVINARARKAKADGKKKETRKSSTQELKHCTIHGECYHDDSECRAQKGSKQNSKGKVTKRKTHNTPTSKSSCGICKKDHKPADCPLLKSIIAEANNAKGSTHSDKMDVDHTTPSTSKPDAKAHKAHTKKANHVEVPLDKDEITAIVRKHFKSNRVRHTATDVIPSEVNDQIVSNLKARKATHVKIGSLIDSGASAWMTPDEELFDKLRYLPEDREGKVYLADDRTVPIKGYGDITYTFGDHTRTIKNVLFVPDLAEPLCSVLGMIEGSQDLIVFSSDEVYLYLNREGRSINIGRRVGDLYHLLSSYSTADDPMDTTEGEKRASSSGPDASQQSNPTSDQDIDDYDFWVESCKTLDVEGHTSTRVPDGKA